MLEHIQEHIASVILAALSIRHFVIVFDGVPGTATIRCHIVPLHWDHVQARFIPAPRLVGVIIEIQIFPVAQVTIRVVF